VILFRLFVDEDPAEDDGMDIIECDSEMKQSSHDSTFLPALVQSLLALIHPTSMSFPPFVGPSSHPPITSALSAIHVCALECLNNIFLYLSTSPKDTFATDERSGPRIWNEIWRALNAVGMDTGPGQERRRDMWEIAVGVLWGIGNVWKGFLVSV
jgi:hypothetical protein